MTVPQLYDILKTVESSRSLKRDNREAFDRLVELSESLGFDFPSSALALFKRSGVIAAELRCEICNERFDSSKRLATTCGAKCNSVMVFARRRAKHGESGLSAQYAAMSKTISSNTDNKRQKILNRISRIIASGKLYLLMRIVWMSHQKLTGIKTLVIVVLNRHIAEIEDGLGIDLTAYRSQDMRVAIQHGLHNLPRCPMCGKIIYDMSSRAPRHCSHACNAASPEFREMVRNSTLNRWKDPEYSDARATDLRKRWESVGSAGRTEWSEKMIKSVDLTARRDAALVTKLARGLISASPVLDGTQSPEMAEYRGYRNAVCRHTKAAKMKFSEEELNSIGPYTYHLDHIFPISRGYYYNIPPELIGGPGNIQIIPAEENRKKSNTIGKIPTHVQDYLSANKIII